MSETLPINILGSKDVRTVTDRILIILALGFVGSFLVVNFAAYWWSFIILWFTILIIMELGTQWGIKKEEYRFKGLIFFSQREFKAFKERGLTCYLLSRVAFGVRVCIAYLILMVGRDFLSNMFIEPGSSLLINESYYDTALHSVAILLTMGGMYFILTYGYDRKSEKLWELCDKNIEIIPGEVVFYCRHCETCGKCRLHRVHIYRAKELSSKCMACEMGEEKHREMTDLIKEWADEENKRFKDMTVEERGAYFDMSQEEKKAFRKEWRENHD